MQDAIEKSGINYRIVEFEGDSIANALWYDESCGYGATSVWINNEPYAWCCNFNTLELTGFLRKGAPR